MYIEENHTQGSGYVVARFELRIFGPNYDANPPTLERLSKSKGW